MVVSQKILRGDSLIEVLTFNCKGDTLIIETQTPVLGISSISNFSIIGEYESLYFQFKATVDSVNWTEWMELSLENLLLLNVKPNHPFQIQYKVTCLETTLNYIERIELEFEEWSSLSIPSTYKNSPFSKDLNFLNKDSLLWSVNVLEKYYKKGIVPSFIERGENKNWEDQDYLDFFWTFIYTTSLRVTYNNIFKDLLFKKDLLRTFLKQRDLHVDSEDLGVLYYLATHYYNELRNRGTLKILEENQSLPSNYTNITLDGELLRLLNLKSFELESFTFVNDEIGWFIGKSCPLYPSGSELKSIIKGWEVTESVTNLENYPLINSNFIQKVSVSSNNSSLIDSFLISLGDGSVAGIGYNSQTWSEVSGYSIPVNPKFSYEITFLLKGGVGQELVVGVDCFNHYGTHLGNLNLMENLNLETNTFLKEVLTTKGDKFYFFRFIIWSIDYTVSFNSSTLLGGKNLRFRKENTSRIIPKILVNGKGGEDTYIYDLKIRPCIINSSEFISQENLLYLRGNNDNKELSDSKLKNIINNKLIPYDMELEYRNTEV